MFYLRQENYDPKYPKFRVIKSQSEFWLQNYLLYEPLSNIIDTTIQYPKYKHIFLLDDQRFEFFSYNLQFTTEDKLTITDVQSMVQEKIYEAERHTKDRFFRPAVYAAHSVTVYRYSALWRNKHISHTKIQIMGHTH